MKTVRLIAGFDSIGASGLSGSMWPNRVINCSSTKYSRTSAMSATVSAEPSAVALMTIRRIASARSGTPVVRTRMSPTPVRTDPPGTSAIQPRIAAEIIGRLSRCSSSAPADTSTLIS